MEPSTSPTEPERQFEPASFLHADAKTPGDWADLLNASITYERKSGGSATRYFHIVAEDLKATMGTSASDTAPNDAAAVSLSVYLVSAVGRDLETATPEQTRALDCTSEASVVRRVLSA